jgi:flagellar biosynthesis chaperone FliJ
MKIEDLENVNRAYDEKKRLAIKRLTALKGYREKYENQYDRTVRAGKLLEALDTTPVINKPLRPIIKNQLNKSQGNIKTLSDAVDEYNTVINHELEKKQYYKIHIIENTIKLEAFQIRKKAIDTIVEHLGPLVD